MADMVLSMAQDSLGAMREEDKALAEAALIKEKTIDEMKRQFRRSNRDRYVAFKRGESQTEEKLWGQVISNDIISNLEGIGDNVVNVLEAFELAVERFGPLAEREK